MEIERPRPPHAADERAMLVAWLEFHRATLRRKAAGLDDEQARRSVLPSPLTAIGGLVKHLRWVEAYWCRSVLAGEDLRAPWDDGDDDADFRIGDDDRLADLVAAYEQECARSNAVLEAMALDEVAHGGDDVTVRWVLIHLIEETARHNGHADVVRELLDGSTGW